MIIITRTKTVKGSPRKLRIPARVVKGMMLKDAISTLTYIPKEGARLINKTLKTALADAVHNFKKNENNLKVLEVRIDESMKLRRYRPSAKGMAKPFVRKYSHITVLVQDINDVENSDKRTEASQSKVKKQTETKAVKKVESKKTEEVSSKDIAEVKHVGDQRVSNKSAGRGVQRKVSKGNKKVGSNSKSKVAKK